MKDLHSYMPFYFKGCGKVLFSDSCCMNVTNLYCRDKIFLCLGRHQKLFKRIKGTNLVLGPPEKFYCRNPSGTFRDVHWYHSGDPKKVPGAPSQGFLIFLGFYKNITFTKIEIWLWYPHFWADFQVSYHFGKLLTARSQGFTASKNQSLDQWDMSISKMKILTP